MAMASLVFNPNWHSILPVNGQIEKIPDERSAASDAFWGEKEKQTMRYMQMSNVYSIVATNANGTKLWGLASMIKYTDNDAFLCALNVISFLQDKLVEVEESPGQNSPNQNQNQNQKNNCTILKVTVTSDRTAAKIFDGKFHLLHVDPSVSLLLEHMLFKLIQHNLKINDFDKNKNVTIDLNIADPMIPVYRDHLGFIVTGNIEFVSMNVDLSPGCALVVAGDDDDVDDAGGSDGRFVVRPAVDVDQDLDALTRYDQQLCGFNRAEFLRFVFSCHQTTCLVAEKRRDGTATVQGTMFVNGRNVLSLYADSGAIAVALVRAACRRYWNGEGQFSLTSLCGRGLHAWLLASLSESCVHVCHRLRRYHTRTCSSSINWSKVYAVNSGNHVV